MIAKGVVLLAYSGYEPPHYSDVQLVQFFVIFYAQESIAFDESLGWLNAYLFSEDAAHTSDQMGSLLKLSGLCVDHDTDFLPFWDEDLVMAPIQDNDSLSMSIESWLSADVYDAESFGLQESERTTKGKFGHVFGIVELSVEPYQEKK